MRNQSKLRQVFVAVLVCGYVSAFAESNVRACENRIDRLNGDESVACVPTGDVGKVERLLEAAARHVSECRCTSPVGGSAADAFRMILDIQPDNLEASIGLRQLGENVLCEAQRQLSGEPRVERLLAVAEAHELIGRFTEPEDFNALETYATILELDPNNIDAQQGMQRVAAELHENAARYFGLSLPNAALDLVQQGLRFGPSNQALLDLRTTICEETPPLPGCADSLVREGGRDFERTHKPAKIRPGRYHALVIGNETHQSLPALRTATKDARAISSVLGSKYGFKVTVLLNASRFDILFELNEFRASLSANDNFLIYYGGHSEIDRASKRCHWLPVDAEPDNSANWISRLVLTDLVNAMAANHIALVVDSCFSPRLSDDVSVFQEKPTSDAIRSKSIASRSRTVLESGALGPVAHSAGPHSLFADAFLKMLMRTKDSISMGELYSQVDVEDKTNTGPYRIGSGPGYFIVEYANHQGGDFVFVPQ